MTVWSFRAVALVLVLAAPYGARAQPTSSPYPTDVVNQGAAFFVFTEPGAPTVQVVLVQTGARAGVYRVAEGTTLTDFLALAGVAPPQSTVDRTPTQVVTQTTTIRVLRGQGGSRQVIYEADPDRFLREPGAHPLLQTGDVVQVEIDTQTQLVPKRFTLIDGLDVAARIASFASLVILLSRSASN